MKFWNKCKKGQKEVKLQWKLNEYSTLGSIVLNINFNIFEF